jgi:hypothetical protein
MTGPSYISRWGPSDHHHSLPFGGSPDQPSSCLGGGVPIMYFLYKSQGTRYSLVKDRSESLEMLEFIRWGIKARELPGHSSGRRPPGNHDNAPDGSPLYGLFPAVAPLAPRPPGTRRTAPPRTVQAGASEKSRAAYKNGSFRYQLTQLSPMMRQM